MSNETQVSQRAENFEEIITAVKTKVHDRELAFSESFMASLRLGLLQEIDPYNLFAIEEASQDIISGGSLEDYHQGLAIGKLLGFAHNVGSAGFLEDTV